MSTELYLERLGEAGPELVLLHGWGLHGGVLRGVAERLALRARVYLVDLPGFGRSPLPEGEYGVASVVAQLRAHLPAGAHWIGWSLGGHLALATALAGGVERLTMVSASPCFTRRDDWPHAIEAAVLEGFAASLEQDYRATLQRFLALQARGSERARDEVRSLRAELFAHGEPSATALRAGLEILAQSDLRAHLADCPCPVQLIGGRGDGLAPAAALEATAALLPQAECQIIDAAGHAPFLSHPEAFFALLEPFIHG